MVTALMFVACYCAAYLSYGVFRERFGANLKAELLSSLSVWPVLVLWAVGA